MANVRFDQFVNGGEMQIGDIVVGLRPSDITNNYQFNFPGSGIKDSNGNYLFQYATVGLTAVNSLKFINSISGSATTITASGSDTNIGITINPVGTGVLTLDKLTWPVSDGLPNSFMITDGAGHLSFTSGPSATSVAGTNHQVLVNGTSGTPLTGILTLTLPQDIDLTSSPTFNAPIFTAPILGTPTSGTLTNCTGLPVSGIAGIGTNISGFLTTNTSPFSTLITNSSGVTSWTSLNNGQLLIGSTIGMPTAANLTAGTNITITNGPGSITISSTGGGVTPQPLTATNDTNVTLTLGGNPANALLNAASITAGWAGQLSLARGGTNASLTPSNGGIVYSTATGLAILPSTINAALVTDPAGIPIFTSQLLDGQIVIGATSGSPTAANLTAGTNITITNSANNITISAAGGGVTPSPLTATNDTNVTLTLGGNPATALVNAASITAGWAGQLSLARGGTNASLTPTNGGIVYSTASSLAILAPTSSATLVTSLTGIPTFTSHMLDGQIVIGATTGTPTATTLTAGVNITITNSPGNITIAATGGGVVPQPLTATNDTNVTLTLGGNPANALLNAASITAGWAGQLSLARGGTNAALTPSNGGIVYSTASALAILPSTTGATLITNSSGIPTFTSHMLDGQIVIGATGGIPVAANLIAGSNISITNSANSITIAATGTGGFTWNVVTTTSQVMASENGYIVNNASLVTLTLPPSSAIGDEINIVGKGAGGWRVQCGSGQTIVVGNTTTSTGGTVSSTQAKDSFFMICTVANTEWTVASAPQSSGLTIV